MCQLGGSDPTLLARAAKIVERYGYDEITSLASSAEASIRLGADQHYVEQAVQEVIKLIRRVDGYQSCQEVSA